jgi:hypothetical protein
MITLTLLAALLAQDDDAKKILERYETLKPKEKDLALFQLDWAPSLKEAKERAKKEGRPVFLVTVKNEHGGVFGGHC